GIRDFHVTGVQTCALPIFCTSPRWRVHLRHNLIYAKQATRPESSHTNRESRCVKHLPSCASPALSLFYPPRPESLPVRDRKSARSEERRVGKECRSRWASA